MYLLSDSPDTPEGHGLSFRWSRDGLFICNAAGERVFDLTEQFATIRYVWAKNTWYNFVIFLLADNQMALRVQVLAYDEYSDSFSVATETNEGNPYWPGNWTDVNPSMPQNAGYVHFVLPAAQASGARIEDFSITGYGGPSYAVPAFRRSELAVSGHEVSWSPGSENGLCPASRPIRRLRYFYPCRSRRRQPTRACRRGGWYPPA